MRSRSRDDAAGARGSITAEFAVVIPAVVVILAACLGGVRLMGVQLQLQDAAAAGARSLGRGESLDAATNQAHSAVVGSSLSASTHGSLVCVTANAARHGGLLGFIPVAATSCSLADGK
jgi:Flp pilus assembly protein TadG